MSKVILHIGTHKSATTTIQDTFFRNADRLAQAGVIYPRYGRITGHHGLVHDWSRLPDVYRLPGGSRAALADLSRTYGDGDATVFLSSEEFSRASPEARPDFDEVRELLSGFDEIEIMVTVRIQWQFLQSIYLELAKKRRVPRPPELVRQCLTKGMYAGLWLAYGLMYDHLLKSFDPSEIHFVDYHGARNGPGGILGYYLDHMNAGLSVADLDLPNNGASNVSPEPLASWAANLIAEPEIAPPQLVDFALGILHETFGEDTRSCLFIPDELEKLDKWSEEANARLSARLEHTQPGFRVTGVSRDDITLFRDKVGGKFWIAACHGLYSA